MRLYLLFSLLVIEQVTVFGCIDFYGRFSYHILQEYISSLNLSCKDSGLSVVFIKCAITSYEARYEYFTWDGDNKKCYLCRIQSTSNMANIETLTLYQIQGKYITYNYILYYKLFKKYLYVLYI